VSKWWRASGARNHSLDWVKQRGRNFIIGTEDLSMRAFDSIANIVFEKHSKCDLEIGKRWIDKVSREVSYQF